MQIFAPAKILHTYSLFTITYNFILEEFIMTFGEIKVETLRLMFANNGDDIHPDDLPIYEQDESYRFYLVNMPESLNRCLSRIEERRVLPSQLRILRRREGVASLAFVRFDLSAIPDFFDVDRVIREDSFGNYDGNVEFRREGNVIVLPLYEEEDGIKYSVLYKPKLERVHSFTENDKDIGLPDGIASIVPYYLKGDLFRDDESEEASEARNWFEQALDEILDKKEGNPGSVESVYSQAGW